MSVVALRRFALVQGFPLLTLRGAVAGVGVVYLALGAVADHSDIVASILVALGVVGLLLFGMLVLVARILVRRGLELRLIAGGDNASTGEAYAGQPFPVLFRMGSFVLPPLTTLRLQLKPRRGDVTFAVHQLTGRISAESVLREDVRFPHRGAWEIEGAELSVSDLFGFFRSRWVVEQARELPILPPQEPSDRFPVVSSSERPGDDVPHARNRQGDPYELKPYHPADGMRKIVWKIFAKRGELVSRHPEASMSPEGQTLIYAFTERSDDDACGLALDYVRRLSELNLDVYFSTAGASSVSGPRVVHERSQAVDLVLRSVWEQPRPQEELDHLVTAAARAQGREVDIRAIVLLCSMSRFVSEAAVAQVMTVGDHLVAKGIAPVIFIAGERVARAAEGRSLLAWWFYGQSQKAQRATAYQSFLTRASQRGWEVYR